MNYMKVGIDASKEKLVCAYRSNGVGEVKVITLANRKEAVKPWIEKLQTQGIVQVCYEASSVGYALYRWLAGLGAECEVVAPSLIPKKAGNHVKTDTRDAKELLSLFEAGLLTSVHVPTESEEALRDLVRSRGDMRKTLTQQRIGVSKALSGQDSTKVFDGPGVVPDEIFGEEPRGTTLRRAKIRRNGARSTNFLFFGRADSGQRSVWV